MDPFVDTARRATRQMRALFPPTPLLRNDHLSAKYGAEIWLKREDLAPVRSYKLRGAFWAMAQRLAADPDQDLFVCASAGNHAQGVAYVCRHFGVRGVIFMPVTTPQQKIMKTKTFGGGAVDIRLTGDTFDEALASAQTFCAEASASFLPPFDDPDVIAGQASVAVEIFGDLGAPDILVMPVGGGGLSAGMTQFFQSEAPRTERYYVEPTGGASLTAALAQGALATLPGIDTFVDGAAVARIGETPFQTLRDVPKDRVLLAPEDRICTTILEMLNVEGIVLEPAGALSLDVLPQIADQIAGKRVVCVSSGGNFDFERLPEVKERAQRYLGLKEVSDSAAAPTPRRPARVSVAAWA